MARLPITIPPGVFRNGTQYQAKGRYYDTNLVRWYGTAMGPIGGWRQRGTGAVTGAARASLAWKDNSGGSWLAIGTSSNLYVSDRLGTIYDITPVSFTIGRDTASASGGFGSGLFGGGTFGTPRMDNTQVLDATQFTFDTWGEYLIAVSPDDRVLLQWQLVTGTPAAKVTNSPTCSAVVVTPERFVFALGTTDPRTVSWCDQENNTVWTPSATNQAGDFPLQTEGRLMCGKNVRGGTLLFTDIDAYLANYVGGTEVYGFQRVGDGCGAISRQAAVTFDMQAAWMSLSGFWLYNGYVQPIPCDVFDYVQRDINLLQRSKIFGFRNSAFSEIEWRYCSSQSTEIDRCVVWNYLTGRWTIGRPVRTCAVDRGVFSYPIMVGTDGKMYEHEVGFDYAGDEPYGETGPIELGNGDNIMHAQTLIPDDATLGDVTATFYVKGYPDESDVALGPYQINAKTDIRFAARMVRMRITGARGTGWRFGSPLIDLVPGGRR